MNKIIQNKIKILIFKNLIKLIEYIKKASNFINKKKMLKIKSI